jgi:ABC-type sugar transport system permease subunit
MALRRADTREVVAGIQAAAHRRLAVLLTLVLLLAPALGLRFFTSMYPFLATAYLSLTNTSPFAGESSFVGLENYRLLLHDLVFRHALSFTLLFVICSTAIELLVGLLIALVLNAAFRLRSIVRAISLRGSEGAGGPLRGVSGLVA